MARVPVARAGGYSAPSCPLKPRAVPYTSLGSALVKGVASIWWISPAGVWQWGCVTVHQGHRGQLPVQQS